MFGISSNISLKCSEVCVGGVLVGVSIPRSLKTPGYISFFFYLLNDRYMEDQTNTMPIGRFNKLIAYFGGRKYTMAMLIIVLVNIQLYEKRIDSTGYVTIIAACLGIFSYANVAQKKLIDTKPPTT